MSLSKKNLSEFKRKWIIIILALIPIFVQVITVIRLNIIRFIVIVDSLATADLV